MISTNEILCIVGSEEKYWDLVTRGLAKQEIINIFKEQEKKGYPDQTLYISGESPRLGVDIYVKALCKSYGKRYRGYPPFKNTYEYYMIRNKEMADACTRVIAIEPITRGHLSGAKHVMMRTKELGKPTEIRWISASGEIEVRKIGDNPQWNC